MARLVLRGARAIAIAVPPEDAPLLHPEAGAAWFQALSIERQEAFHAEFRARVEGDLARFHAHDRRLAAEALSTGLVFAVFDYLCPSGGLGTAVLAMALGTLVGWFLQWLEAGRVRSGTLALVTFFVFQWISRGGPSGLHLFLFLPVAVLASLQGLKRENGD